MAENDGCLAFLVPFLKKFARREAVEQKLPFRVRDNLLTKAELSFYHVLRLAVQDRYLICPKVGLSDVFYVAQGKDEISYWNKISQKHVDFLLCDPATTRPVAGIELDDSSHRREKARRRDEFVNQLYADASLPLIRFSVRAAYTVDSIREAIEARFSAAPEAQSSPVKEGPASLDEPPICPKCGVPMVLRKARKSEERFWGCPNYPNCHETKPVRGKTEGEPSSSQ